MVNFGPLAAEIGSGVWGIPANFNGFRVCGSITARHSSSGREPNFAALDRGRHLYSAGRPSRWVLAHILVFHFSSPTVVITAMVVYTVVQFCTRVHVSYRIHVCIRTPTRVHASSYQSGSKERTSLIMTVLLLIKYCDEYVCLCVCLSVREDIFGITRAIFTNFFAHVAYVRGTGDRRVGPMNHALHDVYRQTWEGASLSGKQADHSKV